MSNLKTFIGSFYRSGRCNTYESIECIIVAETESVALGLALESYPDTSSAHWSFEELDPTTTGCTEVSRDDNF